MTYNGWTNYETWLINLWLTSDEAWYGMALYCTTPEDLKDLIYEYSPATAGLYGDLIGAALSEVDWQSIHEHLQEGIPT